MYSRVDVCENEGIPGALDDAKGDSVQRGHALGGGVAGYWGGRMLDGQGGSQRGAYSSPDSSRAAARACPPNSHLDPTKHDPDVPLQTMVVGCCYDRRIRSPHSENSEIAGEERERKECATRCRVGRRLTHRTRVSPPTHQGHTPEAEPLSFTLHELPTPLPFPGLFIRPYSLRRVTLPWRVNGNASDRADPHPNKCTAAAEARRPHRADSDDGCRLPCALHRVLLRAALVAPVLLQLT